MLREAISSFVIVAAASSLASACSSTSEPGRLTPEPTPAEHLAADGGHDTGAIANDAADASCVAMFDIPDESMAEDVCHPSSSDCAVCVQAVGPGGAPNLWLVQYNASACPCPAVDAGVLHGDGGAHADAAPSPDAASRGDDATDAAPDASCVATFDIGTEWMAEQICGLSTDCAVCVQHVDAQGNATTWLAQQNASSCPCPAPSP